MENILEFENILIAGYHRDELGGSRNNTTQQTAEGGEGW